VPEKLPFRIHSGYSSDISIQTPKQKNVVLPLRRGNAQLSAHTHYIFLLEIIETGLSYHVKYVVNANNENKAKQS
jgi:hypothetical protein